MERGKQPIWELTVSVTKNHSCIENERERKSLFYNKCISGCESSGIVPMKP
ncbi:hypothetical protein [Peptostreptococcus anaerobius]|uniref:hypothetical protein n=1 Tax=Peptostreptococcus anaerobius TaxID=1261 RepID=UPI00321B14D4